LPQLSFLQDLSLRSLEEFSDCAPCQFASKKFGYLQIILGYWLRGKELMAVSLFWPQNY
jgi:hypothetical protein